MASPPGNTRSNLIVTVVVVLLLSLVGAGVGFSVGVFLQPTPEAEMSASKTTSAEQGDLKPSDAGEMVEPSAVEDTESKPVEDMPVDPELKIVPLPPVLTTLAAPQGKWIRLEGVILAVPGTSTQPELLAERAGEHILTYLRTVKLEQLQGPSGFLTLRDDLNETVNALSKGDVHSVLIHGLLVE